MTKKNDDVCPNCGYCEHCGRSAQPVYPVYPTYPVWPTLPWYWGSSTTTAPVNDWTTSDTVTISDGNDTGSSASYTLT